MSSFIPVSCPICQGEVDILRGYGAGNCCDRECHDEWDWRRTLAIMGEPYRSKSETHAVCQELVNKAAAFFANKQEEGNG